MSSSAVDWNSGNSPQQRKDQSRPRTEYMKLKVGKNTFRPVGDPFPCWKYMIQGADQKWRSGVVSNESDPASFDERNCPVRQKMNKSPSFVWVLNVIDREENKLKILEMNPQIYNDILSWANSNNKSPSGQDGVDFTVEMTKTTTAKGYQKNNYNTYCAGPSPFKQDEIDMISEIDNATGKRVSKLYDIKKMYKAKTPQEVISILEGNFNKNSQNQSSGNWNKNSNGNNSYNSNNNQNTNSQSNNRPSNNNFNNQGRDSNSSNKPQIQW